MKESLHEAVKKYIFELIQKNSNVANYLLPSENQISIRLNVSRFSVRKALASLEDEGIIFRVKGKGAFVRENSKLINSFSKTNSNKDFIAFISPNFFTTLPHQIAKGIREYCNEIGVNLMFLCAYDGSLEEEKCINFAKSIGCKGMIIFPSDDDNYNNGILALALDKFPTVLVDRMLFGLNLNYVGSDNYEIGYKSTDYLVKKHRNICIVTVDNIVSSVYERLKGYTQCLQDNRIFTNNHLMLNSTPTASDLADYFSAHPEVTAVICNSGRISTLLIKAMNSLNKTINKDYELVLLDEDSLDLEEFVGCKLPTIVQDTHKIGYTAAKTLCDYIYDGIPTRNIKIPLLNDLS